MRFQAFVGPSYQAWSPKQDIERAINLYPEASASSGAKSPIGYYGRPGLQTFTTLPTAPVRGLWAGEQRLFAAGGSRLYEVFSDDTFTDLGDIGDDSTHSPVQMFPNGNQLMVVSAGGVIVFNGTTRIIPAFDNGTGTVNTAGTAVTWVSGEKFIPTMANAGNKIKINGVDYVVASVTDDQHLVLTASAGTQSAVTYAATLPIYARTGAFLDSYFIVNPPDSKTFFFSQPNDGTVWDALDFSVKEGYPDNISALFADHEELWVFGTHASTEVWRNEGDPDAAAGFRRDPGAFVHIGCVAPWSIVSLNQGLYFLGGDAIRGQTIAYRAQGFQPVRVSNHAVEQIWSKYTTIGDAYAYSYVENGHQWWVINFQTADATWAYDLTTQMWSEWPYWDGTNFGKHRARCHAFTFGQHFVGDWQNGKIYQMSQEFLDDAGAAIKRVRVAPYVAAEEFNIYHHRLELEVEVSGSSPAVTLDFSDDGVVWSTPRTKTPSRPTNDGKSRVFWQRLGGSRSRIYRVSTTAAARIAIVDASIELTAGFA